MAIKMVMRDYSTNVSEYTCLPTDAVASYPSDCAKGSRMYIMNAVTKMVSQDMVFDGLVWKYSTSNATIEELTERLRVSKVTDNYSVDLQDKMVRKVYIKTSNTSAVTITNANVPRDCEYELLLDYATAEVITWFSGITWLGGSAPTLTATHKYVIRFVTIDGGATWLAKADSY